MLCPSPQICMWYQGLDVRVMLLIYPCLRFLCEPETIIGSSLKRDLVGPKSYLSMIYMNAWNSTTTFKNAYSIVELVIKEIAFISRTQQGSYLSLQFFQCKINSIVHLWTTQLKICYTIIAQSYNHIIFTHTHQQWKIITQVSLSIG